MSTHKSPAETPDFEVNLTRLLNAPRALVFQVWTEAEHLAQWWGPAGFTNPVCEIDLRPGGAIYIVMRAPDGVDHPMSGTVQEVLPPERFVFVAVALDDAGQPLLEAHTTVTFSEVGSQTKVHVNARGYGLAPVGLEHLRGMEEGWSQSLEKLAAHVDTIQIRSETADREIKVTRLLDAPRERVFQAWTDPQQVGLWWVPAGFTITTREMDVRPGGAWRYIMHDPDGCDYRIKIAYLDVVPQERLVYEHGDDRERVSFDFHITVTFEQAGRQTRLTMRSIFPSAAERDYAVHVYKAIEGVQQTLERLALHLGAQGG